MRNSLFLLGVTSLWHVSQWVSRAPPHHILPAFLNPHGTKTFLSRKISKLFFIYKNFLDLSANLKFKSFSTKIPEKESRFESANLLKASRVADGEYELELRTDLYTDRHTQWFYFQVSTFELKNWHRKRNFIRLRKNFRSKIWSQTKPIVSLL